MKTATKVAGVAVASAIALTGCGPAGQRYYQDDTYCVDTQGHVVAPQYCNGGGYVPNHYFLWTGPTHGHHYYTGSVILPRYYNGGVRIVPTNAAMRAKYGIPRTGMVKNGFTTKVSSSTIKAAQPGSAPKSTVTSRVKSGISTTKSRISSGFSSARTSVRSSFGGRK